MQCNQIPTYQHPPPPIIPSSLPSLAISSCLPTLSTPRHLPTTFHSSSPHRYHSSLTKLPCGNSTTSPKHYHFVGTSLINCSTRASHTPCPCYSPPLSCWPACLRSYKEAWRSRSAGERRGFLVAKFDDCACDADMVPSTIGGDSQSRV